MPFGDYLAGAGFFALTFGSVAVAAELVRRRALAGLHGAAGVLGYALVLTSGLILVGLLPGALGILTRGTVALTALAVLMATVRWHRRAETVPPDPAGSRAAPPSGRLAWAMALATVTVVAVYIVVFLLARRGYPITARDALTFELPGIVHWIQEATLWPQHYYVAGWAFTNYPHNGELVELTAILPWHTDALVRLVCVPYLLLSGLGVYALARELGAPRAAGLSWGAMTIAMPAALVTALDYGKTDTIMLACFVAAATFLVRHARTHARSDLVLGGLGLGLALGTKWYGLTYGAVALVVWLAGRLAARAGIRKIGREGLVVVGMVALAGGFWLLRNLVETGNPIFPQKVAPFGLTLFDAPTDVPRMQVGAPLADYLGQWHLWSSLILPVMRDAFALPGALAGTAMLAVAAMWAVRPRRQGDPRVVAVAACGLVLLAVYLVTPYTAQGPKGDPFNVIAGVRYAMPGFALGAVTAAWLTWRAGRWGIALQAAAFAGALDALLHVDDAGAVSYFSGIVTPLRVGAALGLLGVLAAAVLTLRRLRVRGTAAVLVAGSAALGCLLLGYIQQDRYLDTRFKSFDPTIDWVIAHAPAGHRIAIAGGAGTTQLSPFLPLAGPRLANVVEPLGRVERDVLHPPAGRAGFEAEVRRGRFDLVWVGRPDAAAAAPEEAWARALGYVVVARGDHSALLQRR